MNRPGRRAGGAARRATRPLLAWPAPADAALLTDLYELTMAQSYWRLGMNSVATFDLFVREAPANRRFLVAAGLEHGLAALEAFRFRSDGIEYLGSLGRFDPEFLGWLETVRFTGDVRAIPEGEPCLPGEPLVEIAAPLIEAQLVETLLLNTILFPCTVASKAARVVIAAKGRAVIDFSPRRDQGADAAVKAARASYLAGCAGTSNVLAGRLFAIPVSGTMAHAYVMAFEREADAFRAFASEFPGDTVLLIDTYDTVEGARRAAEVGREIAATGGRLRGVRIDSGDLGALAGQVRAILDDAGLSSATILASGDLNEWRIEALVGSGAPIDAFGVGTDLGTSSDAPALGGVYKLVAYDGRPVAKRSPGKPTLPGPKQVWRGPGMAGTLSLEDERVGDAVPLLSRVMREGRASAPPPLADVRARCLERVSALPEELRSLAPCPEGSAPTVALSEGVRAAAARAGSGG